MSDTDQYKLKWKGRQSGPYSIARIRALVAERQVSLMHEVFDAGEWITLRKFLQRLDAPPASAPAPVVDAAPARLPQPDIKETKAPVRRAAELLPQDYRKTRPAQQSTPTGAFFHAGFWLRFGALAFDALLVLAVLYGLHLLGVLKWPALPHSRAEAFDLVSSLFANHVIFVAVTVLLLWLYFAIFESSQLQATPGKRITGLRVVRVSGGPLTFADASVRFAAKLASAILAFWGFFLAAFTEHKQALHDVIAKCYVVGAVSERRAFN